MILERSECFVEDDRATYRSSVLDERLPVFHESSVPGEIDERTLAHSTVWRWISSLSELIVTLNQALEMIRARSPSSDLFRRPLLVAPVKYRSEDRRLRLQRVRLLIHTDLEYRALFRGSIFPGIATASGFG